MFRDVRFRKRREIAWPYGCAAVFAWAVVCMVPMALAQEDDADEKVVRQPTILITEQYVEQRILGSKRNVGSIEQVLETELSMEIRAIDNRCTLVDFQRRRLELAGHGDITRFLHHVEEIGPKRLGLQIDQQQYLELNRLMQPLQIKMATGIFGDASLFRKILRRTLTEQQLVQYRTLEQSRRLRNVEEALAFVARNNKDLRLSDTQRQQIVSLLLNKANPPLYASSFTPYVILFRAGKLQDSLQPLMDEKQWAMFQSGISMARRVEPTLRTYGLLHDAEPPEEELASDAKKD